MRGCGSSPRLRSTLRKAPLTAASTTSLTVPPSSRLMALMSVSDARAQAYRRCRPMGPLSEEPGAGLADVASFAAALAVSEAWRIASAGRVMAAPTARTVLARQGHHVQYGLAGQLRRRRLARWLPACLLRCTRRRPGSNGACIEHHPVQLGAGHPVDHRMVHLGDQRPPAVAQAIDQPVLPERVIAVEPLRHHSGHQRVQLLIPARRRERRLPQVITEIEIWIIYPDRRPKAEWHGAQLPAVDRDLRQAGFERGRNSS